MGDMDALPGTLVRKKKKLGGYEPQARRDGPCSAARHGTSRGCSTSEALLLRASLVRASQPLPQR